MSRLRNRIAENDSNIVEELNHLRELSDDALNGDSSKMGEYLDGIFGKAGAPYNTSPLYKAIKEYCPDLEDQYETACDSITNGLLPALELVSKVIKIVNEK